MIGFFWGAGAVILAWLAVEWWRAVHKPEKPIDLGPDWVTTTEALRRELRASIKTLNINGAGMVNDLGDLKRTNELILEWLEHSESVYTAASRYDANGELRRAPRQTSIIRWEVDEALEGKCFQNPMPGGALDMATKYYEQLKAALVSAIVCDTCLGARRISNQCVSCLGGSDAACTCDEMEEFDCPQCDGCGWSHREPEKHKEICQALYDEQLNYLPERKS